MADSSSGGRSSGAPTPRPPGDGALNESPGGRPIRTSATASRGASAGAEGGMGAISRGQPGSRQAPPFSSNREEREGSREGSPDSRLGAIFAGPRRRLASMRPRLPNRDAMARAGTLGTGIVIGALLGAGLALIFAPQSGEETRAVMRRSARGARLRATDAWDGLADELHFAARRTGRRVARAKRRVRYVAEDVLGDRMPERFSRRG